MNHNQPQPPPPPSHSKTLISDQNPYCNDFFENTLDDDNNNASSFPTDIHNKPLLFENGLTNNTHRDKDCSGGEEETTSHRNCRCSRWDPQPDSISNNNNSSIIVYGIDSNSNNSGESGSGPRKRKSRWADDELKPLSPIQLPDFMKELTGGIKFDPEIQAWLGFCEEVREITHGKECDRWGQVAVCLMTVGPTTLT